MSNRPTITEDSTPEFMQFVMLNPNIDITQDERVIVAERLMSLAIDHRCMQVDIANVTDTLEQSFKRNSLDFDGMPR